MQNCVTFHLTCAIIINKVFNWQYFSAEKHRKGFITMDNNRYDSHRPRKRVSRKTLRNRRLAALFIIAFIVLLFIILIAKGCSKDSKKNVGKTTTATTITTTTTTTDPAYTTMPTTTTSVLTDPVNKSDFVLDKTSVFLEVGETDTPYVTGYPDGTYETDERWSSGDPSIATVDSYGHIKGISKGVCYVTLRSAADPKQEVMIKVTVRGDETENETSSITPQSNTAEAPEPPVYDTEGLTYVEGVLIANKSYSLPPSFAPGLEKIVYTQFQALSSAAAKEGLSIYLGSGYRSYSDQEIIYDNYVKEDGKEAADMYSARPGYSEHQTGLCIDCNTIDDSFGYTAEAAWLAQHAHEYGFIIRYPQGKEAYTGYQYEPWHIRYVGSKLAKKLYKSGQCLEEYLNIKSEYKSS